MAEPPPPGTQESKNSEFEQSEKEKEWSQREENIHKTEKMNSRYEGESEENDERGEVYDPKYVKGEKKVHTL